MLAALRWLCEVPLLGRAPAVMIYGDSELIVKFMTRKAVPRRLHLATRVTAAQELRRRVPVPTFVLHVPRERNEVADWLSRCGALVPAFTPLARLAPGADGRTLPSARPSDAVARLVGATASAPPDYPIPQMPCAVCGEPVPSLQRHCSGCPVGVHLGCCGEVVFDPRPWFCEACLVHAHRTHTRDILLDRPVMDYLHTGELPPEVT